MRLAEIFASLHVQLTIQSHFQVAVYIFISLRSMNTREGSSLDDMIKRCSHCVVMDYQLEYYSKTI